MSRTKRFFNGAKLILIGSILSVMAPVLIADTTTQAKTKAEQPAEKATDAVMKGLTIGEANETKVRQILVAHFATLKAWHEENDSQIKDLWSQFNQARAKQDEAKADEALARIDGVYGTIHSEHERFLAELATAVPDQVERVKDALTVNKVKVTNNAYHEIFHGLKPDQEAFILKNLQAAREEAIDAGSMKEKSAFFKKYKIRIEAYLTAQGYNVKQAYQEFVAKQKAEMTKKGTQSSKTDDEKESE